jgi:KamA family protein
MTRFSVDGPTESERRVLHGRALLSLDALRSLPESTRAGMALVTQVLPFKVNGYVLDRLIDWENIPEDPIFRLTFPDGEMLTNSVRDTLSRSAASGGDALVEQEAVDRARRLLNPDPSGQMALNVPSLDGRPVRGLQHKYRETVLVFPSQGQTCHSYCGYCFRWPQFVGKRGLRHTTSDVGEVADYLASRGSVTDVIFTGGDPLVMRTELLERYIQPILDRCPNIQNIRIGTKALAYWPYRFTWGEQADSLLRLFERVVAAGRSLTVMAHLSHPNEMVPGPFRSAVRRILSTGATIRSQAPIIRGVNDRPETWKSLWTGQVRLGITPYYMFVERDTGAHSLYSVPLATALGVYTDAIRSVSGLARSARGPVLSAPDGKILLDGSVEIGGQKLFSCRFIQARDNARVGAISLYHWDDGSTWIDQLRPYGERGSD